METIYRANVWFRDSKAERKAKDVMIVGNNPDLIMRNDYLRNYLVAEAYKTAAKIKTALADPRLRISKIEFISSHGKSNVYWGTTDPNVEVKLTPK